MTKVFEKLLRIEFVFGVLGFKAVCFVKFPSQCPLGSHQVGKHQHGREMDKRERRKLESRICSNRGVRVCVCPLYTQLSFCMTGFILFAVQNCVFWEFNRESKTCDLICCDLQRLSAVSYLRGGFCMYKIFWYYFGTLEKRKIEGKHKKLKIFLFKRRLVLIKYSKISRSVSYKRKTKHFQRL